MKLELSRNIFEKYSDFMKIHPVVAELFHADGQRDMTKILVAFRSLSNAPKNKSVVTKTRYIFPPPKSNTQSGYKNIYVQYKRYNI